MSANANGNKFPCQRAESTLLHFLNKFKEKMRCHQDPKALHDAHVLCSASVAVDEHTHHVAAMKHEQHNRAAWKLTSLTDRHHV